MNREMLARHLAIADAHVEEGVRHIRQQQQLIALLRQDGQDTGKAVEFLEILERTLSIQRQRRDWLRRELAREQLPDGQGPASDWSG